MKRHIPNFITSLNLVSGFLAIVFAGSGDIITASWLILAAMIFDFLDGFAARMLKSYSDLGKELDSLADLVSFGVAPALIIFSILNDPATVTGVNSGQYGLLLIMIVSVMPVCAALRLAKFNIDTSQTTGFKGLPTPANGLAVISVVIAEHYSDSDILAYLTGSVIALLIFTIALSVLMVSRIPLLSLKTKHLKLKGNEGRYMLVLMVGVPLLIWGIAAAPIIIPVYIFVSVISLILF